MQAAMRKIENPETAVDRDWWRGAVIYQIYPRSYQDSNGDGIGDLQGIIERLPHIADLGADAVWISPFFKSPMKDFGYDISDYLDIDPMFGTLADFDAMISEAHRLGLKVMIDGVISHTSDLHPWFKESRSSRDNAKADWYVWADAKPDGSPPNNWLSIFGGSAWQWDTRRMQYYLHNFLSEQPDLNFHNRDVQDALLDVARFWLDGASTASASTPSTSTSTRQGLEDNPALPPEQRNDQTAPAVNPYNFQDHIYDKSRPENLEFLARFRAVLDEYPAAAAVGEVGDSQRGLEVVASYTAGGDKVQMCYAFDFLAPEKITATKVRTVLEDFGKAASDGWSCWAFSNHDVVRHASRWGMGEADGTAYLKVISALMMSLRGSVCIYQGEELGLTEAGPRLRGSAGPLWHPLLARIQGPRRLPHADGVEQGRQAMAASPRPSRGCRCRPIISPRRSTRSRATPPRCSNITAASLPSAAPIRRWPRATSRSSRLMATPSPSPAAKATRRSSASSILAAQPANVDLGGRRLQPLPGHGLDGNANAGAVRLGGYGAWFGRIDSARKSVRF
jgi:alpha-glucosidase